MVKEKDVVLVYVENQPAFFARIESITPDVKPEWFQVKMLVLQIPMIVVTWILKEAYINGVEFTMGGRPVKILPVVAPSDLWDESEFDELEEQTEKKESKSKEKKKSVKSKKSSSEKIISITERKNRNDKK